MLCPQCNNNMRIIDTIFDTDTVYRTRICLACGRKMSTKEAEMDYYEGRTIIAKLRNQRTKERRAAGKQETEGIAHEQD